MGNIQLNCPHVGCGTKNAGFRTFGVVPTRDDGLRGEVFAICSICKHGIVLSIAGRGSTVNDLHKVDHMDFFKRVQILEMFPQPIESEAPNHIPENVESVFLEACDNLNDGRLTSAAGMFRSTLDRMVRHFDSEATGTLFKRIEALQESQNLPVPLIDLMHQIRFLGNEIHDEEDPDQGDVDRAKEFARLILTYVFELPREIELHIANREGQPGEVPPAA